MNIIAATSFDSVLRFITLLFVFAIVLGITYYVTRWIGNFQKVKYSQGNIKIIEAKQIGTNKFIYIAQIGNDYFALSSGKDNFNVIGKIDPEGLELPDDDTNKCVDSVTRNSNGMQNPFSDFLKKAKDKIKPKE